MHAVQLPVTEIMYADWLVLTAATIRISEPPLAKFGLGSLAEFGLLSTKL